MGAKLLTPLEDAIFRGRAWSGSFEAVDPTGADDQFFNFKNKSSKSLVFVKFRLLTTVLGTVELHRATGDASNTPVAVILNNLGAQVATPDVTVETGVNLVMTLGLLITRRELLINTAATHDGNLDILDNLPVLVAPGTGIALNWETATGILDGTFTFYEVATDDEPTK